MLKQSHRALWTFLLPSVLVCAMFPGHFEHLIYDTSGDNGVKRNFINLKLNENFCDGRIKRPAPPTTRFTAFNRTFDLVLRPISPNVAPFSKDLSIYLDGVKRDIQPQRIYEGHVRGDDNSLVFGSVFDGFFDGHIYLSDGKSYTVERTSKYHKIRTPCGTDIGHSFIYNDQDISEHGIVIGQKDNDVSGRHKRSKLSGRLLRDRNPRQGAMNISAVRSCSMHLQVDQTLFAEVFKMEGRKNKKRTLEEIVSMLYINMRAVNGIYNGTNFNGVEGIHFAVRRISVFTPQTCSNGSPIGLSDNPFCEETSDAVKFLRVFAVNDHISYCLSYAFTNTYFESNIVGIAVRAGTARSGHDGVCGAFQWVFLDWWFRYISLNTAVITTNRHGVRRALPHDMQLTLAHELGHSLGAGHDTVGEDDTNHADGVYMMHPNSQTGMQPNHRKFSTLANEQIAENLKEILSNEPFDPLLEPIPSGTRRNCFQ